jgi:hypothetical protein
MVRSHFDHGQARVTVMESGVIVASVHSRYVTTLAHGEGLDVGLHLSREQAADLIAVLQEALS